MDTNGNLGQVIEPGGEVNSVEVTMKRKDPIIYHMVSLFLLKFMWAFDDI
jgi:hypothetical protein